MATDTDWDDETEVCNMARVFLELDWPALFGDLPERANDTTPEATHAAG